jgi:signal transduction histidine kinase
VNSSHLLPLFLFGTILFIAFTVTVILAGLILMRRQIKNRLARQQMEFDHSRSLLDTRVEVRENTLNMIAQELHDNITQAMTGCYMQVNAASEFIQAEQGKEIFEDAKTHLLNVIRDVRLLSHSLATGMVEHRELQDAIQAELSRIQAFTAIECSLESDTLVELPPHKRLLLFRTVQETLQNALKHAEAKQILVHIHDDKDYYYLSVTDDGRGFDDATLSSDSFGLRSIRERIEMLKGNLQIVSKPGSGTVVKLRIPIN